MTCQFRLNLYPDNNNIIELRNLREVLSGTDQTDATVQATLYDRVGNTVPGQAWPLPLVPSGGNNYFGTLDASLEITNGAVYRLVVEAVGSGGQIGTWDETVKATLRSA